MANYKPQTIPVTDIGGYVRPFTSEKTLKVLRGTLALTGTNITFHDILDLSNYQVPTGKKLTILGYQLYHATAGWQNFLMKSDTLDSNSNEVKLQHTLSYLPSGSYEWIPAPKDMLTVQADWYLSQRSTSASSNHSIMSLYGYEENA